MPKPQKKIFAFAALLACAIAAMLTFAVSAYAAESFTVTYHAPKSESLKVGDTIYESSEDADAAYTENLTANYKIPETIECSSTDASSQPVWSLDGNGGTISGEGIIVTQEGYVQIRSTYLSESKWTKAWNDKKDGSGKTYKAGDTLPTTANLDLYAVQEKKITETPAILPTAEKPGYIFEGWYAQDDPTLLIGKANDEITITIVDKIAADAGINRDVVKLMPFVAHYTPCSYTIEFDGNGATAGSTPSMTFTYGDAVTMPASGFTRTGCTFAGWSIANDGTQPVYAAGQAVEGLAGAENGATIKMYAMWVADGANTNTIAATADESPVAPLAIVIAASFAASAFVATRRRRQR